jgi:hypothetical protein
MLPLITFIEETPMMLLHALTNLLRKRFAAKMPQARPTKRLQLEGLEDRVVPDAYFYTETYTNATVQITPGLTMTEKVTASVTPFPSVGFSSNNNGNKTVNVIPIPTRATIPTSGIILFNLNNQMQSATLNANGQATATFQVPLLAFLAGQTLTVNFQGTSDSTGGEWGDSTFVAPLYMNFDNLILSSTLTFGQLTPQQVYAEMISTALNPPSPIESPPPPATPPSPPGVGPSPFGPPTVLNPYYTAQAETDSFGLFGFNYVDPGTISTVTVLGLQLPGIFALNLGAFNGLTSSSSSSS